MNTANKLMIISALLGLEYFSVQAQESVSLPDLNLDGYALQMPDMNSDLDMSDMLAQRGGMVRSGSASGDNRSSGGRSTGSTHSSAQSGGRNTGGSRGTTSAQRGTDTRGGGTVVRSSNSNNSGTKAQRAEQPNRPAAGYNNRPDNNRPQDQGPRPGAGRPGSYPGYRDPMPPPPPPADPAPEPVYAQTTYVSSKKDYWGEGYPKYMTWIYGGLNLSRGSGNDEDQALHFNLKPGATAGFRLNVSGRNWKSMYFGFGLNYNFENYSADFPDGQNAEYSASMFEIPVMIGGYVRLVSDDVYLGFGIGPSLSVGLGGTYKSHYYDENGNRLILNHDTYGDEYRHKVTGNFKFETWLSIKRVYVGYSWTCNWGEDNNCFEIDPGFETKGYQNNCIMIGYRLK